MSQELYHIVQSGDELYHYGVAGMKWGVRRYQNEDGSLTEAGRARQARKYAKELNAKDQSTVFIKRKVKEAEAMASRFERKASRTKNVAKKLDFETRAKNTRNSVNEERKAIEKNRKETEEFVKKIAKEGYSVNSKDVARSADKGSDWAKTLLVDAASVSLAVLFGAPYAPVTIPHHMVEGKKYKVKG